MREGSRCPTRAARCGFGSLGTGMSVAINRSEELLSVLSGQMHEAGMCRRVDSSSPGALEDDRVNYEKKKIECW